MAPASDRTPSALAFADDASTPSEKCGFFLHVLIFVGSVTYTAWILQWEWSQNNNNAAPAWTITIPACLVFVFFGTPFLYGSINAVRAAPAHSLSSLKDAYSTQPDRTVGSDIPEIGDYNVAEINDMLWKRMKKKS